MENGDRIDIHERIVCLEKDTDYIKKRVDNHIPHQIKDLDKKVEIMSEELSKFMISNRRQFISILISIILMLLGILFSFLK